MNRDIGYSIRNNNDVYTIVGSDGDLARDTNCDVFVTRSHADAIEAARYLNQNPVFGKRAGSHRMKSIFGVTV